VEIPALIFENHNPLTHAIFKINVLSSLQQNASEKMENSYVIV